MILYSTGISRLEIDSFVFFLHDSLVLKYADSSNQRDFFLRGLLALGICGIKQSNTRDREKTSHQEQALFLQSSSLFLGASVSGLLNKESTV